jgi:hypothetical protein
MGAIKLASGIPEAFLRDRYPQLSTGRDLGWVSSAISRVRMNSSVTISLQRKHDCAPRSLNHRQVARMAHRGKAAVIAGIICTTRSIRLHADPVKCPHASFWQGAEKRNTWVGRSGPVAASNSGVTGWGESRYSILPDAASNTPWTTAPGILGCALGQSRSPAGLTSHLPCRWA